METREWVASYRLRGLQKTYFLVLLSQTSVWGRIQKSSWYFGPIVFRLGIGWRYVLAWRMRKLRFKYCEQGMYGYIEMHTWKGIATPNERKGDEELFGYASFTRGISSHIMWVLWSRFLPCIHRRQISREMSAITLPCISTRVQLLLRSCAVVPRSQIT